uniref:WD_REPEATS_REGION domain-containing protein n=1 Tax=Heterorhabditis bacteriophora TaxID=37862 RepID=A0A1I7XJU6_HETBA
MFHSIGDAWTSASRNNMADVKELIPEFFTLPEMMMNKNKFDLGVKQNGVVLDNVVLPPWAHGDPREFIRLHRQALECDYVSSHLHEWIDLVFGYKQNGDEAVKACNLFHHLFYEGNVDFESIDDPLTRNATIGFVNNFGQIPTQLFKKPHPPKKVNPVDGYCNTPGVTTQRLFYHSLHSLKPPQNPIKELRSAVGSIYQTDRSGLIALEQTKVLIEQNRYIAWGFSDRSIRLGQIDSDKVVCSAHAFVVSASRDCSVIFWHQSELSLIRQLPRHSSPVSAVSISETTGDVATACSTLLHVWSINGDLLAVINTCDSSPVMDPSQMILSLAFSTMNEWDTDNVVICGTSDGVVKIYSCIMVENDGSVENPHIEPQSSSALVVQARLDKQRKRLRVACSLDTFSESHSPEPPLSPARSISGQALVNFSTPTVPSISHPQFVRVLVQRAALTTHTAFNRPDNTHPAPITVIVPSKYEASDNSLSFIVFNEYSSINNSIGMIGFNIIIRFFSIRHIRSNFPSLLLFLLFRCSRFESHITHMKISRPVRVCQNCFLRLKAQTSIKPKGEKKVKTPPSHPTYSAMIKSAIKELKDHKGASKQAILKFITQSYKVGDNVTQINSHLRTAIKRGVSKGDLKQVAGTGAAGRFKLPEKANAPTKAKSVKVTKTPSETKPKKTVKKAVKAKSEKKAKSPKKASKPKVKTAKSSKKPASVKKASNKSKAPKKTIAKKTSSSKS